MPPSDPEAQGLLQITVVKAMHLKPLQSSQKAEAFATITVGTQHGYTQAVSTQGQEPVWNETLTLPVSVQPFRRRGAEGAEADSLLVASDALQVEVHERDVLVTESLGTGMLTLGDLPRGIPVPRTLRLGSGKARLLVILEAQDFGLAEDPPYRGSSGRLKVHVVRATALLSDLCDPADVQLPSPLVYAAVGTRSVTTQAQPQTLDPEWMESFELPVRLWPDTKESAEPLRIAMYDGAVGEHCLGAAQLDLSKLYEGTLTSKTVLVAGMGKLFLQLEAIDFGVKGGPPSHIRLQEHNMDVGVLQISLSNFRCTSGDDVADKAHRYFIRTTCGDQAVDSPVETHPHWTAAFRVPMPLSLTLSGDRVAAEPVRFEVWRGAPGDRPVLVGACQPEVAHLHVTGVTEMDLWLEQWSAVHLLPPGHPVERVALRVVLDAMDFGLRPAARQLETPRDAEVRPVRKYGPLDIQQLEVRAVGVCLPPHSEIPSVVEAVLLMDGREECTAPGQACASPNARVWNSTCSFSINPSSTLQLRVVIRGRNSMKAVTPQPLAHAELSLTDLYDLLPSVEQRRWVDLPGGFRLQLAVKAEHYSFSRAQLRSIRFTVKDAKQLPDRPASRWAIQLWWQDSPLSAVRTQAKLNSRPPLVWNEDFELLVSPAQSLNLMVAALEMPVEGEADGPETVAPERDLLAFGNVALANWSLAPGETAANAVPLKSEAGPVLTEVLLAVRPLLFDFPRNELSAVDVTVTEGRGFCPAVGQQLCVCLMMDDVVVKTPPADAISRPVWGHKCSFDISAHCTLQLLFTVELADNPSVPVAVGHVDLTSWPLQQEVMRGWVQLDTGEEAVDVRLRVNIEARFSLPPPTYRQREAHPSLTGTRNPSISGTRLSTSSLAPPRPRRVSEPLQSPGSRARTAAAPPGDRPGRSSLPIHASPPRSAGTGSFSNTPSASRDSSLSLSGPRRNSSRSSTPRSSLSLSSPKSGVHIQPRRFNAASGSPRLTAATSNTTTGLDKVLSTAALPRRSSGAPLQLSGTDPQAARRHASLTTAGARADGSPKSQGQPRHASLTTAPAEERSREARLRAAEREVARLVAEVEASQRAQREELMRRLEARKRPLLELPIPPPEVTPATPISNPLPMPDPPSQPSAVPEVPEVQSASASRSASRDLRMSVSSRSPSTDLRFAPPPPPPPPPPGYRAGYRGSAISNSAPPSGNQKAASAEANQAYRGKPSALMNLACERREGSVTALRGEARALRPHAVMGGAPRAAAAEEHPHGQHLSVSGSTTPLISPGRGSEGVDGKSPRLSVPRARCDAPSPSYALYRTRMASYAAEGTKYFSKKDLAAVAAPSARQALAHAKAPEVPAAANANDAARSRQTSLALRRRETGTVHMAPRASTHVVAPSAAPRARPSLAGAGAVRRSITLAPPSSNPRPGPNLSLAERLANIHRPPGAAEVATSSAAPVVPRLMGAPGMIGHPERPFSARGLSTQRSDPPVSARKGMQQRREELATGRMMTPRVSAKGSSTFV